MRNWMKQLGVSLGLVFAVGAPSAALAYPPQCFDVCSCASSCDQPCYWGTFRTTCAEEMCVAYCTQASLSQEEQEAQQQEAAEDVCSEETSQPASAES